MGRQMSFGNVFPMSLTIQAKKYINKDLLDIPENLTPKDIEFLRNHRPFFVNEIDHYLN
jgi:hypothetical protein